MALVESLQKAIDYMEEHLFNDIKIEDIAKEANISPFHFQRTFMILTDISIGEYLRRRRLTLAAQELISTNRKVIDLAYRYGYETPEAFSKAFRKQHKMTPTEARKGFGRLRAYNRLTIQVSLKGADPMNYRMIEKDAFQVVGVKRTCTTETTNEGLPGITDFWADMHQQGVIKQLLEQNNGQIKGLLGINDCYNDEQNTLDYWIATEHKGSVPEGMSASHFPASKWVVFEVRGPVPDAFIQTWRSIYSEWFPSNRYEPADIAGFELYISEDVNQPDSINEIWIAIK